MIDNLNKKKRSERLYKNFTFMIIGAIIALLAVNVVLPSIKYLSQSSQDRAIEFVKENVYREDDGEPLVFPVIDAKKLSTNPALFEGVQDDDLLILFTDKGVIYSEAEKKIILVVNLKI